MIASFCPAKNGRKYFVLDFRGGITSNEPHIHFLSTGSRRCRVEPNGYTTRMHPVKVMNLVKRVKNLTVDLIVLKNYSLKPYEKTFEMLQIVRQYYPNVPIAGFCVDAAIQACRSTIHVYGDAFVIGKATNSAIQVPILQWKTQLGKKKRRTSMCFILCVAKELCSVEYMREILQLSISDVDIHVVVVESKHELCQASAYNIGFEILQSKYDTYVFFRESICHADELHACEIPAVFDGATIVKKEDFLTAGGYRCGEQCGDIVKRVGAQCVTLYGYKRKSSPACKKQCMSWNKIDYDYLDVIEQDGVSFHCCRQL